QSSGDFLAAVRASVICNLPHAPHSDFNHCGLARFPLEITPPAKKLLTVSRSFGSATESYYELCAAIVFYVSRVAETLRHQKLAVGWITVFIEADRFKPEPQFADVVKLTVALKSDSNAMCSLFLSKSFRLRASKISIHSCSHQIRLRRRRLG